MIDELQDDMCDMLHVLVKKYGLASGDISPEDTLALAKIIVNYVENNLPKEESKC